jgi:hypothetical protein
MDFVGQMIFVDNANRGIRDVRKTTVGFATMFIGFMIGIIWASQTPDRDLFYTMVLVGAVIAFIGIGLMLHQHCQG